jgi:hypothetical protein
MSGTWTIDDVLATTGGSDCQPLQAPAYLGYPAVDKMGGVALAVESMSRHMTDEGWQIMLGLQAAEYGLVGPYLPIGTNDVRRLLEYKFSTAVIQDKREWTGKTAGRGFDPREQFVNMGEFSKRSDIFKLNILKDAHSDHALHVEAANEIGCHGWVVYYHPRIVKHLAPYVREEHLVRTYHSIDKSLVPKMLAGELRGKALLSGAISRAYPLRARIAASVQLLPDVEVMRHPGYGRDGCKTGEYLRRLNLYKVAICTASKYGFALRKIIEASACGCRVITDLPADEVLPCLDENLIRVRPDVGIDELGSIINYACRTYDDEFQQEVADAAKYFYDYRRQGRQLALDIEHLRRDYQ